MCAAKPTLTLILAATVMSRNADCRYEGDVHAVPLNERDLARLKIKLQKLSTGIKN